MLLTSLQHGYSNLANFKGRDSRALFWPFAGMHIAAVFAILMPLFVAEMNASLDRIRVFAEANPTKVTYTSGPNGFSINVHEHVPGLGPDLGALLIPAFVLVAIFVVLSAAAVTRRLHDTGWPGWVGAIPAVLFFLAGYNMIEFAGQLDDAEAIGGGGFLTVFVLNFAYNISLIVLIILLCLPTKPEANRYGEPPA
jgi:uncharacterized membrane protein YhaH (DUF805 family)